MHDILGSDELGAAANVARQIHKISFVLLRQYDAAEAGAMRGEHFCVATGNTKPVKVISPVIAVSRRTGSCPKPNTK